MTMRSLPAVIARCGLFMLLMLVASWVHAQDGGALVSQGRMVFRDQGCFGCHIAERMGTPIATDLSRIGARRDEASLAQWLRDPRLHRPTAHMPKIDLSDTEVRALAAYLGSLR